jgi:ectoine hydroxylase-related dioxygenase (phytanoyl-CoA dioxygenase family)
MHPEFRPPANPPIHVGTLSTAAQRRLLDCKGYLSLSGVYDTAEIEILGEDLSRLVDGAIGIPHSFILELATERRNAASGYDTMQINWIDRVAPDLLETSVLCRTRQLAESLLGGPAQVSFGSLINKSPVVAGFTPWHQDAANDGPETPLALGFWIPLISTEIDNGCLCYAEGSHRRGLRPHTRRAGEHSPIATFDEQDEIIVACPVPLGGVALHHRMTLHCALPNRSSRPRPVLTVNFIRVQQSCGKPP